MANALVSGQIQVAQLDPSTVSFVKSKDSVVEFSGTIYASPLFDKKGTISKAFASVQVRQALSIAVNRAAIAKLHPGAVATASFFPPGSQGYDSALESAYAYNPAKAKQLLAEAGYPHGFSFTVNTVGDQLDIDLQAIQQDWQDVGVRMTIEHATSYAAGLQAQSTTPIGYNDFTIGRDPLGFVNSFLLGGTFNPQHATSREIASALQVAESGNGNSDVTALKNLDDAVVNEGWVLTVYEQPAYIGYDSSQVQAPESSGSSVFPQLSSIAPALVMAGYLARRSFLALVTIAVAVVLSFLLVHLTPGSPGQLILGAGATKAQMAAKNSEIGWNRPLLTQLGGYLADVARGNLGTSIIDGHSIGHDLLERLPVTGLIAVLAAAVSAVAGAALGLLAPPAVAPRIAPSRPRAGSGSRCRRSGPASCWCTYCPSRPACCRPRATYHPRRA